MRSKMIVITSSDMVSGFKLAGVDVLAAETGREAEEAIEKLILGSEYNMVAVNESFMKEFSDRIKRLIGQAELPVIVPFPGKQANVWKMEDRIDYVANLIRSAIGYHIKLSK